MLLVSCGGEGDGAVTTEPDGTTDGPGNTTVTPDNTTSIPDGTTTTPSGTTETPSTTEPGTKPSDSDFAKLNVTEAYPFSEGLAFIRVGDRQYELLCINKDGNVEFKIENPDKSAKLEAVIGFCNGIAALDVGAGDGSVILCKKDGTVIDPKAFGGDTFVVHDSYVDKDMFSDGYVLLRKNSADFNKTRGIYAVVDYNMETVLDFSEEFTILFESFWPSLIYYADHIYVHGYDSFEICYDIKAGTYRYGQENETFLSTLKIDTDKYTRINSSRFYYDITDLNTILLKFDDSQNVKWCDAFNSYGYAPIVMTLEDANGAQRDCFTVIDGQGKYAFDPIKLKNGFTFDDNDPTGLNYIRNEGNLFIMRTDSENGYGVTVFDQNGIVGELTLEFEEMPRSFKAYLSDGVVLVAVVDSQGNYSATYYEPDFDKIL